MSKKVEVVLDRAGLAQLAAGITVLTVLGFTAGAVVGFEAGGGLPPAEAPGAEVPSVAASAAAQEVCIQPDPAPIRMASEPVGVMQEEAGQTQADARATVLRPEPAVRYTVQLGVFGVEANADRFASDLRSRGYDPLVAAMRNRSGQWMRRVSLSVHESETDARVAAEAFQAREGLPAVVVAMREDGS